MIKIVEGDQGGQGGIRSAFGAFRPGGEVFGRVTPPRGSHADYVLVPETSIAAKPTTLDHVHAAALGIAGLTAYQTLVNIAQVQPGQRVLVHGAYVIGTARRPSTPSCASSASTNSPITRRPTSRVCVTWTW
ncbi:hypothetical protein [Streptomyces sp. NPDC057686]|uniref:hypothetical protein n=1 Tax=Streptomyces sp. NPDC057686 TaxID=3346212 RepID=UPI003689B627